MAVFVPDLRRSNRLRSAGSQTMVDRGCGLDVHQAAVVACLLVALNKGTVKKQIRTFNTTPRELVKLREWLLSQGCTHVAMESTGV
jgi:hypothetical protein